MDHMQKDFSYRFAALLGRYFESDKEFIAVMQEKRVKISSKSLYRWSKGESIPPMKKIIAIAEILKVPALYLLHGELEMKNKIDLHGLIQVDVEWVVYKALLSSSIEHKVNLQLSEDIFAKSFCAVRKKMKKTQNVLADEIGISLSTLKKWEKGTAVPGWEKRISKDDLEKENLNDFERLQRFCETYKIPMEKLCYGDDGKIVDLSSVEPEKADFIRWLVKRLQE